MTAQEAPTVGWIGLGALGTALAARAVARGWRVCGCDLSPDREEEARRLGVAIVDGPAAAARAADDLVVCVVRDAPQVHRALLSPEGALHAAPGRVGVVMSSTGAAAMEELADRDRASNGPLVAAPVLGNPTMAAAGDCTYVVSGEASAKARALPLLQATGRVVELGERLGEAQAMKSISQVLQIVTMLTTFEMMQLGDGYGLTEEDVLEVVRATEPSWTTEHWEYASELWRRRDRSSSLGLFAKDLDGALKDAESVQLELPVLLAAAAKIHSHLRPDN